MSEYTFTGYAQAYLERADRIPHRKEGKQYCSKLY